MPKVAYTLFLDKFIALSFHNKFLRFRKLTGEKLDKKYWNPETQRVRGSKEFPQYLRLNHLLDTYASRLEDFYRECLIKEINPSKKDFEAAMYGKIQQMSNNPFAQDFINDLISERSSNEKFRKNTIKSYISTRNLFDEFCLSSKRKYKIIEISNQVLSDFKDFLISKNQSSNTTAKYIRILKTFIAAAHKAGILVHKKYTEFKLKEIPQPKIYLTVDELYILFNTKFETPRLQKAVHLFLMGAFTGLRFSDFTKLAKENIDGDKIRIQMTKTSGIVIIPIHPIVKTILAIYGGPPPVITLQRLNLYIKEACELVKLTGKSILYYDKGGVNRSKVVMKSELVSSHTARRSFATNAYKAGIPSMSIMKITGHKTESSFMRYIGIDGEEAADLMAQSSFFKARI